MLITPTVKAGVVFSSAGLEDWELIEVYDGFQNLEAARVWGLLRQNGLNEWVVAGIIGNMMVECGGHTLELNPFIYGCDGAYYGLCQWSKTYYPNVFGANLETQISFLMETIENQFNRFGFLYSEGFNYNAFLELSDEGAAAVAFAVVYERCNSKTYELRGQCAAESFNYFNSILSELRGVD